ncbi:MAG: 6-phosphogluconolactonase [Deltaproteobacteria bacterium]|nr:6-phosphogluconolactonase [Deltaproteobacteria bacterium]
MRPEIIVDDQYGLQRLLVERFTLCARAAIAACGRFSCVLPGGSVAEVFFPSLAATAIDWSHVDFFWGDERAVAADDPDSNYRLAKALWLDHIPADPVGIHRMLAEEPDLDAAAATYATTLQACFHGKPRFDFVLLGVGADGHVCSLFPDHPAVHDSRFVVAVHDSPKPPPRRMTLTLAALDGATALYVAAFGEEKAAVIAEAIKNPPSQLPVALVARAAGQSVFLLDAAAATLL